MAVREPDPVTDPLCDGDPLARALAKLRPTQTGLDGQRLLYLAGQAERDRSVAFWRRVSVMQLAALLLVGGVFLMTTLNDSAHRERTDHGTVPPRYQAPAVRELEEAPPPRPASEARPDRYYGIPQGFARAESDDLSPDDRARWLVLRNDVLTAGLGLLPTPGRYLGDPRFMKDSTFHAIPLPPEPKTPPPDRDLPED